MLKVEFFKSSKPYNWIEFLSWSHSSLSSSSEDENIHARSCSGKVAQLSIISSKIGWRVACAV